MNKLITTLAIAGALLLGAATPLAQDVNFGPSEAEPAPKASKKTRRAEGEQMLGSMKGQARVAFAKNGAAPTTLTGSIDTGGSGVGKDELKGKYCRIRDNVYVLSDAEAALIAEDFAGKDGYCLMKFTWAGGVGSFSWYGTLKELIDANDDVEIEDKSTSSGDGKSAEAVEVRDPWATWRQEGRSWTHEMQGGITMKSTVKKVTKKGADVETVTTMNGNPVGEPTTYSIKFSAAEPVDEDQDKSPKPEEKEIECKAGTFVCWSWDGGNTWMMKKYLGIVVKSESMELIEFIEKPTDSADKPDKPAEDDGSKPADMSDYWERYVSSFKKGRTWTYDMTGGIQMKNEVTEVTETKATVKSTMTMGGNPVGDPTENDYDLVQKDSDDGEDAGDLKWTEKEIETKAGKFTGVSIDGKIWLMKKHPIIILKGAGMELTEFTE